MAGSTIKDFKDDIILYIFIGITCFITYFLHMDMFGAYSDDQYFLAIYNSGRLDTEFILDSLRSFGRPLGTLTFSILYPLFAIGGLSLAYMGSFIFLFFEAALVFTFFRIFFSKLMSYALALVYLLFPADTTKFMFNYAFCGHVSAIMFWTSAILYEKRRTVLSALCAALSMLVYESYLAQAVFIPLIVFILRRLSSVYRLAWQQDLRQASIFWVVFGMAAGLLLVARLFFAPGRLASVGQEGVLETAQRLLSAGWLGMQAILLSHADRLNFFIEGASFGLSVLLGLLVTLNVLAWRFYKDAQSCAPISYLSTSDARLWAAMLFSTGLLLMYVSYLPFALVPSRWPPTPIGNLRSGVHLGASVGYVLTWAGFFQFTRVGFRQLGNIVSGIAFISFSIIVSGFFIIHQKLLIQNWALQTIYWRQIEECLREVEPRLIVVDSDDEEQRAGQVASIFDWTTPYVPYLLEHDIRQAEHWPLVQTRLVLWDKVQISSDTLQLTSLWTPFLFPTEVEIDLDDILVVKPLKGALQRSTASINFGSSSLSPRQICYDSSVKLTH